MLYGRRFWRPSLPLVMALALVALLALACGDGGGGGQEATPGTPEATETRAGQTPTATLPPGAGTLEQLAAESMAGLDGKVSYRYVSNFGQHPDGVWTSYRLSTSYRQDWKTSVGGFEASSTTIIAGDNSYVCTQATGFSSCSRESKENAQSHLALFTPVNEVPEAIVKGIPGLQSTELPSETIAGLAASCFQLAVPGRIGVGPAGKEEIKICFSQEGLLLSMQRKVLFENPILPEANLHLDAQEVAAATAADFEPLKPVP